MGEFCIITRDPGIQSFTLKIRYVITDFQGNIPVLHPRSGASWEGFVIEEVVKAASPDEVYFWGTHSGAELDLLMFKDGRRIGVECKRVDAPRLTLSMRAAIHDLELSKLLVIYPGAKPYPLAEHIQIIPLASLAGVWTDFVK